LKKRNYNNKKKKDNNKEKLNNKFKYKEIELIQK
jgi:hypothetical protein